jgi:hypothetical protein
MIGDELYTEFMQANQLDMALHNYAREILMSAAKRLGHQRQIQTGVRHAASH